MRIESWLEQPKALVNDDNIKTSYSNGVKTPSGVTPPLKNHFLQYPLVDYIHQHLLYLLIAKIEVLTCI